MLLSGEVNWEIDLSSCDKQAPKDICANYSGRVLSVQGHQNQNSFKGHSIIASLIAKHHQTGVKISTYLLHYHWIMVFTR